VSQNFCEAMAMVDRDVDRLRACLDPAWSPSEKAAILMGVVEAIAHLHPDHREAIQARIVLSCSRIDSGGGLAGAS
jgi:hypothetical protein